MVMLLQLTQVAYYIDVNYSRTILAIHKFYRNIYTKKKYDSPILFLSYLFPKTLTYSFKLKITIKDK